MSKIYTLKLTKEQLWALAEGYAASFTEPDMRNAVELAVSGKLQTLYQRAHKDSTLTPAERGEGQ